MGMEIFDELGNGARKDDKEKQPSQPSSDDSLFWRAYRFPHGQILPFIEEYELLPSKLIGTN